MSDVEDRLRLLARWHARRREVDELLEPLLAHGPAAVERVAGRLDELSEALIAERLAFEGFAAAVALVEVEAQHRTDPVDELAAARGRADRARLAASASVHPSVSEALLHLDLDAARTPPVETPTPRRPSVGEPADT